MMPESSLRLTPMPENPPLWSQMSVWLVLGGAFAAAVPLGALLAGTRYCSLGAVSDWLLLRDTHRARMWLAAAGAGVLGTQGLAGWAGVDLTDTLVPYASPHFTPMRYIVGGLMFGLGMHLASGCASRQLLRAGGGSLKAVLILAAAAVTAAWLVDAGGYPQFVAPWLAPGTLALERWGFADQRLGTLFAGWSGSPLAGHAVGIFVGAALLLLARGRATDRLRGAEWAAGLGLGGLVVVGWWLTGGMPGRGWQEDMAFLAAMPRGVGTQSYTFIAPLADLLACLRGRGAVTFGLCGASGLALGSALWHWRGHRWRVERPRGAGDWSRCLAGGTLLGLGGVTALGCTVGQGITGLSTLALGSLLATLATVAGAAMAIKIEYALSGTD